MDMERAQVHNACANTVRALVSLLTFFRDSKSKSDGLTVSRAVATGVAEVTKAAQLIKSTHFVDPHDPNVAAERELLQVDGWGWG